MKNILYRPAGLAAGLLSGAAAGLVFKHLWRLASGSRSAPEATSANHSWAEILTAAAVQGAIFGVVKASVDRATATAFHQLNDR